MRYGKLFLYLRRWNKKQTEIRCWNDKVLSKYHNGLTDVGDNDRYHHDDPSGLGIVFVFLRDTRLRM